jgi:hypothetical protein
VTDEFFLPIEEKPARARPGRDDDGVGMILGTARGLHEDGAVALLRDTADEIVLDPGSEFFGLLLHSHHQLGAHDAFGKAGKILHFGRGGELAAGLFTRDDKRLQVGSSGIDGGGPAGATGSDDDDIFHGVECVGASLLNQC